MSSSVDPADSGGSSGSGGSGGSGDAFGSDASGDGAVHRPTMVRIAVALAGVLAAVGLAAALLRPSDPTVPGPGFEGEFLGACARTGVPEADCRCAFERWSAAVAPAELSGLDAALADGADLPDDVRRAVTSCLRDAPGA